MQKQHYTPENYKAGKSVGYLLKRCHVLCLSALEPTFAVHGINYMQWVVLMYLRDGLALNPKDICSDFRHDSGSLTRLVDQLEERGLVARQRSREDRRTVELSLTDAGRQLLERQIPMVVEKLNSALRNFSKVEVSEFTRLLLKFIDGVETAPAAAAAP